MSIIDAHSHVWSADLVRYPIAPGYTADEIRPIAFPLEELFCHAAPHGIERVNLIQSRFHGFDNRTITDAIAESKGRCVGTAVIDVHTPHPDREMFDLARLGIRAFRIHPRLSKRPASQWLQPSGYETMFAAGARHNLAISCLIDPDCLPELDRMCRRYPETPVIIDHLCRVGADGEIREADVASLCGMACHPRLYVKIGGFYVLGKKTPPYDDLLPLIERVVAAFGSHRCMWESDCPYQVAIHQYSDSINVIRQRCRFLTESDHEWLLCRTAENLLFASR